MPGYPIRDASGALPVFARGWVFHGRRFKLCGINGRGVLLSLDSLTTRGPIYRVYGVHVITSGLPDERHRPIAFPRADHLRPSR